MEAIEIMECSLPVSLWILSQEIGVEAVLKLVEAYGGKRKYIPQVMRPQHPIARLIGYEAACKLSFLAGGTRIFLYHNRLRKARRNCLLLEQAKSKTLAELAREFNLSTRQVSRILKEYALTSPGSKSQD